MKGKLLLEAMRREGGMPRGHYVFQSGRHSDQYFDKAKILTDVLFTISVAGTLAEPFKDAGIQVVIGPEMLGAMLAFPVATQLMALAPTPVMGDHLKGIKYTFAEKIPGQDSDETEYEIKRGMKALVAGKRVLIVEDVATTGSTIVKVKRVVEEAGGIVAGCVVIANRGAVRSSDLGLPGRNFFAAASVKMPSWLPEECPLCMADMPVNVDLGHGQEFLDRKQLEEARNG